MQQAAQAEIFTKAVNAMAASMGRPMLYGPDNQPIVLSAAYSYRRTASRARRLDEKLGSPAPHKPPDGSAGEGAGCRALHRSYQ